MFEAFPILLEKHFLSSAHKTFNLEDTFYVDKKKT